MSEPKATSGATREEGDPDEDRDANGETVIELERPYARLGLGGVGLAGLSAFMVHTAETNVRGLLINGLIHLDPGQADVFFAVNAVLLAAMSGLVLMSFVGLTRMKEFRLRLTADEVSLPPSQLWRLGGELTLPLAEVAGVELLAARGKPASLVIVGPAGRHALSARVLPKGWTLRAVSDAIMARRRALG